jgi:DNA-directed RNA polymerase omega subunit
MEKRVNVQDSINKVKDHFALVHLVAKRYRSLKARDNNKEPETLQRQDKEKDIVYALREIAANTVRFYDEGTGYEGVIKNVVKKAIRDENEKEAHRKNGGIDESSV